MVSSIFGSFGKVYQGSSSNNNESPQRVNDPHEEKYPSINHSQALEILNDTPEIKTIKEAFAKNGVALTKEEIDKISNRMESDPTYKCGALFRIEDLIRYGLKSPSLFANIGSSQFLDLMEVLRKGADQEFLAKLPSKDLWTVVNFSLKTDKSTLAFLPFYNQYNQDFQPAYAAWATGADKKTIEEWSRKPVGTPLNNFSISSLQQLYGDRDLFNLGMEQSVEIGADGIKKGWSFGALFYFCAFRRNRIAEWQKPSSFGNYTFGSYRGETFRWQDETDTSFGRGGTITTQLSGPYEPLRIALEELHQNFVAQNSEQNNSVDQEFFYSIKQMYGDTVGVFNIVIDGKRIELSTFYPRYSRILHTLAKNVDFLYHHCQKIFNQALQENEPLETLLYLFWLICQTKPVAMGDPSIAEMMMGSVLASKGQRFPGWQENVIPWVEASKFVNGREFAKYAIKSLLKTGERIAG